MAAPEQRIIDVAAAQAATQAAAKHAAQHKAGAPHAHKKSSDLLTAVVVAAILIGTLVLSIAFQR
jgi:F0F1-type ATP synthase assembly protein I